MDTKKVREESVTMETRKVWEEPVLVEHGPIEALTQTDEISGRVVRGIATATGSGWQ